MGEVKDLNTVAREYQLEVNQRISTHMCRDGNPHTWQWEWTIHDYGCAKCNRTMYSVQREVATKNTPRRMKQNDGDNE